MIYLFIDTNVLLHYRRLEEINWLSLAKSKEAVIVLCPAVIRELDQHKVYHPRNKFRKRAQEIITSLHSRLSGLDSDIIRNGVRLEFIAEDPSVDFGAYKLRPELPDDWLIASAIDWKQKHSSDEIRIVSADLGISIKAKSQGIPALAPLEADRVADELDADEKRIKELQRELAEIKNSLPRLKLCFWGQPEDQNFVRFQIPPPRRVFESMTSGTV
jgi:predicted ribonuclease YlaK